MEQLEARLAPYGHVWTGAGGNTNWSNPNNWSDGAPANGESGDILLEFPGNALNFATTDDLAGLRVYQVLFLASGYVVQSPFTFGSGLDLYMEASQGGGSLGPSIIDTAGGNRFSLFLNIKVVDPGEIPLVIEVDKGTLDCGAYLDLNGTGRLLKQGAGTLQVDNGAPMQLFDVEEGTLAVGSLAGPGLGLTKTLTLENGTTIEAANGPQELDMPVMLHGAVTVGGNTFITFNGAIGGASSLVQTDTASVQLNAVDTYTGSTTIAAGGLVLGQGAALPSTTALTVAGGASLNMDDLSVRVGSLSGSGVVFLGSGTLSTGGDNTSTVWTGFIGPVSSTDNLGAVVKQGTGTFTLNGTTNYLGTTVVQAGGLAVGNSFAASVGFLGGAPVFGQIVLDDGTQLAAAGAAVNLLNLLILEGAVTFGGNQGLNLLGIVSGPGSLTQTDPATILIGSADYGGTTTVEDGTLLLASAGLPGRVTIAAGATVSVGGKSVSIGSLAGSGTVTLNGNVLTTGSDNSDSEWTGFIGLHGDAGGVLKQGAGTFTMNGQSGYVGTTEVRAGTLAVGGLLALGSSSGFGKLVMDDGSTLTAANFTVPVLNLVILNGAVTMAGGNDLYLFGGVSGPGSLTKTDAGTVTIGVGGYAGATTITGGHLAVASTGPLSGRVTIGPSASLDLSGQNLAIGSLAGSGTVNLNGGTLTTGSDFTSTTWSGSIGPSGDPGGLTKVGISTMILSGTNTYSGPTTVQEGILEAASSSALSNLTRVVLAQFSGLNVDDFLRLGSLEGPVGSFINLPDSGIRVGYNGLSTSFAGLVSGPGSLDKEGTGTFTFSGDGFYTGDTLVGGGTLREGRDDAFPNEGLVVAQGATFDLNNFQQAFVGVGSFVPSGGTIALGSGSLFLGSDYPGVFSMAAQTITGTGRVIKTGRSSFILESANSYSGLTADTLGTLEIDGAQPSSPVNVGVIANLAGSGTVGPLVVSGEVSPGGTSSFSPGGNVPGRLTSSGDVTFLAGSSLAVRLNGTTAGSGYDQLAANGRIDLAAAPALNLSVGLPAGAGGVFTILTAPGGITGTFAGLPDGSTVTVNNFPLQIHYTPTSVVLTVAGPVYVTTTADSGPGSLRQAILDANTIPGPDVIDFAIPGSSVQTIAVGSTTGLPLPAVTDPVTIDGYSQPGASPNTLTAGDNAVLLIQLDGSSAGPGANGLTITAGASTVRGLVIKHFVETPYPASQGGVGILLDANGGNVVEGNYLGTDAAGGTALSNTHGVFITDGASDNTVGGTTPAARNLISGNTGDGVVLYSAGTGNVVQGNYLGTDAAGSSALGNDVGVYVVFGAASHNLIGGTAPGAGNLISGNNYGVSFQVGANNNLVQGNRIGTNAAGTAAVRNGYGLFIGNGTSDNLLGGTAPGAGNLISGNGIGVQFYADATGNQLQGNYLGTDFTGTAPLGNGIGVSFQNASAGNTIGGTVAAARNVISGNAGYGVFIHDPDVTGNVVEGNYIGVGAAGTPLGNGRDGVHLSLGARANQIGGPDVGAGNVISGNGGAGVLIQDSGGAGTGGNLIQGNRIGTDPTGNLALGNGTNGVTIDGSANNTIGGTSAGARNLISGNAANGVDIAGHSRGYGLVLYDGATGTLIEGNYVGVTASGNAPLANAVGIAVFSSSDNTVGGTAPGAGNVISGNTIWGVQIIGPASPSTNNLIEGNLIGTDSTGTQPLANGGVGVLLDGGAAFNTVGGTIPGARNIISGNDSQDAGIGVEISGVTTANNLVEGNYIGTDRTGTAVLANAVGVYLYGADDNTVGGTTGGAGNLISGNGLHGIFLYASATGNLIAGNYVGTDASGAAALPNGTASPAISAGILLQGDASGNIIGGTSPQARNTISGNAGDGIQITGRGNVVAGNYIGANAAGTAALGNGADGVKLLGSANTIGGTTAAARNVISGNGGDGIEIVTETTANTVEGNFIGTDAAGTGALGNAGDGILIRESVFDSADNLIGGTASGAANTIAFNAGAGVAVTGSSSVGNAIRANSIFANGALGIDLGGDGVTPNHLGTVAGPNQLQNYPVLTTAGIDNGSATVVKGGLAGLANTVYGLDFFADDSADPSSHGQGKVYLGSTAVLTDAAGNASFTAPFTTLLSPSQFVSATATDPAGNTSEFAADVPVDAALVGTGVSFAGHEGISSSGIVAVLVDADPTGNALEYTALIDWGDGAGPSQGGFIPVGGGEFLVLGSHAYAEEGSYPITVWIQDRAGSRAITTSTATVAVVPPTAGVSGPAGGVPGQPRTFTFTATSPSPVDQAAGFAYVIDWGDGTPNAIIPRTPSNGSGVSLDHVYTTTGTYLARVSATEDGGSSGSANQTITVQTVQMQGNSLAVGGTPGSDTILLSPSDAVGDLNVSLNGVSLGIFRPTDQILVYSQSGNDTIQLASRKIAGVTYYVRVPAFLYGGGRAADRDVLDVTGSTANNALFGGAGTNQLFGGFGRDLLVAGQGASQLHAGLGEDILVGGWTAYDLGSAGLTYDRKLQAVAAIMAEWGRTDLGTAADPTGYQARVNDLLGPGAGGTAGGRNGSFYLNGTTVHSGASDTLFGAASPVLDWFFAGSLDVLKKQRPGEVVTSLP